MPSHACVFRPMLIGVVILALSMTVMAKARVDKNVTYGMYSGTAAQMDVHYPVGLCISPAAVGTLLPLTRHGH